MRFDLPSSAGINIQGSCDSSRTSSLYERCPSPVMKLILDGEVGPRSRMRCPSGFAIVRMNSWNPVERRLMRDCACSVATDCSPEPPPKTLRKNPETTLPCVLAAYCRLEIRYGATREAPPV